VASAPGNYANYATRMASGVVDLDDMRNEMLDSPDRRSTT
jgi:hypothetical protein